MSPETVLPTIGEMAITVAGFTGLIVSIRPQGPGKWTSEELIRVLGVVAGCIVTAVCSVLPFAVSGLTSSPTLPWAVPLFLSGLTSLGIVAVVMLRALGKRFRFVAGVTAWIILTVMAVLSVLSLLSSFGLVIPYSAGLLVLQLVWSLVVVANTLVATLAIVFLGSAAFPGNRDGESE